jgi:hypothetical protein
MFETFNVESLQEARAKRSKIMTTIRLLTFVKTLKYFNVANVITRLQQCNIAYFVYHKILNLVNLSKSDLIL